MVAAAGCNMEECSADGRSSSANRLEDALGFTLAALGIGSSADRLEKQSALGLLSLCRGCSAECLALRLVKVDLRCSAERLGGDFDLELDLVGLGLYC